MFKHYTMNQVVLPLDLEVILPENDVAFAVNDLVESIPEQAFDYFAQKTGCPAYHPRMMMKIILCAYTQSVITGRKIEIRESQKEYIREKLSNEETGEIYGKRKIDVEPVFGFLKAILGFTRMSVRGEAKVENELGFALMAVKFKEIYRQFQVFKRLYNEKRSCLSFFDKHDRFHNSETSSDRKST